MNTPVSIKITQVNHRHLAAATAALILAILTAAPPVLDAQESTELRLALLNAQGGPINAALPLPDGSVLAAEGSALLRFSGDATQVLDRIELDHGTLLALRQTNSTVIALAEHGLIKLDLANDAITVDMFVPGGGQSDGCFR